MRSWAAARELVTLWEFNYEIFSFSLSLVIFGAFFFYKGKFAATLVLSSHQPGSRFPV